MNNDDIKDLQKYYFVLNKPSLKELQQQTPINTYINTLRLTMMYQYGICQICEFPEGNTHPYNINKLINGDDKTGFIVCGKTECKNYITKYIKKLYNDLYNSIKWKELLIKCAHNKYINVTRSCGIIETNWLLTPYDEKKTSLNDSFIMFILCCKRNNLNLNLPIELWEYIYHIALSSYNNNIGVKFEYNNTTSKMDTFIHVHKDNNEQLFKKVLIESL